MDKDSYVDNTNTGADTHEQLLQNIQEIEFVARKGGFIYKPWVKRGDRKPDLVIGPHSDDELPKKILEFIGWLLEIYYKLNLKCVMVATSVEVYKSHYFQFLMILAKPFS